MGKSSSIVTGYHYKPAFHVGVCRGPIDAYLEWRVADKTAHQGELTASGEIFITEPNLFGGEKDQGGVVGTLELMFGEATQMPNSYLASTFGPEQPAWRGLTTLVWKGGRFGGNNPYPHKHASKIRKILEGWDHPDGCWYPETANVALNEGAATSLWERFASGNLDLYSPQIGNSSGYSIQPSPYGNCIRVESGGISAFGRLLPTEAQMFRVLAKVRIVSLEADDSGMLQLYQGTGDLVFGLTLSRESGVDALRRPTVFFSDEGGVPIGTPVGAGTLELGEFYQFEATYDPVEGTFAYSLIKISDGSLFGEAEIDVGDRPAAKYLGFIRDGGAVGVSEFADIQVIFGDLVGHMNAAHILYYSRTDGERGREPRASLNDASMRAAADRIFSEGFGLCTHYDPADESPAEFEARICRVIDGSFERSLTDGEWYLDLARGDYDIESLPILTDADILEFHELPTTLDRAVNSLSVRYFDVQRKEQVATPAVRALGLIRTFGEIHETLDFPEIPTAELAMRVAQRELLKRITPTKAFKLVTTPVTYAWRANQYFRLQSAKRRIADMVCIVGERERGTLTSGAIRMNCAQDIYSLPDTSYIEVETSEDTGPTPPDIITIQRADEAPYVELAARLPRAELAALPEEIGYAMAVAAQPGAGWDYTMQVAPDGGTDAEASNGTWCATATTDADEAIDATTITLATHEGLADVELGTAALWDDELVRVDAKDVGAGTVTLARGCADTVPVAHAAGSRLFFYSDHAAYDTTEYADGEEVDVKLLANRGALQTALPLATAMSLTFDSRQARPYPPAQLRVNGEAAPNYAFGLITVDWVHRDRVLQADQLVDTEMATIGPEAGTTYTVRWYLDEVLVHTDSGVTGTSETYTPSGGGTVRIEVESERDALTSWQMQVREFAYTTAEADPWELQGGGVLQQQDGSTIYLMG